MVLLIVAGLLVPFSLGCGGGDPAKDKAKTPAVKEKEKEKMPEKEKEKPPEKEKEKT